MRVPGSLLLSSLVLSGAAFAQAKAPAPDYTLSYNAGVVSDYRYRGISQSARRPALQGGVDLAHKSGAYLGAWGSTISWIKDTDPSIPLKGPVEVDIYGGYKGSLTPSVSFDIGGLYYWYVNNNYKLSSTENANTFEVYAALSAGPATVKYSHSLTPLFGTADSKNSGYLDVSATFDMGNGITVVPHVGWQKIRNTGTYADYSVTVAKDINGLVVSAAVVGTNWKSRFGGAYVLNGSGNKDLAKAGLVLGLKKNF